jgi:hypothetical protein
MLLILQAVSPLFQLLLKFAHFSVFAGPPQAGRPPSFAGRRPTSAET